jgi:hypothetical protein
MMAVGWQDSDVTEQGEKCCFVTDKLSPFSTDS